MVISFLIILFQKAFVKTLTMMNATVAKLGNVVKESHHMICQISMTFWQKMLHVYNATVDNYALTDKLRAFFYLLACSIRYIYTWGTSSLV